MSYNAAMAPKEKTLLPAYLAVGEDELKRRTVIERLRKRVSSMGDLSFNHDVFDGATASGSDIAIACNTFPFASPVRLVEVNHVEKLGKQDADVLVAYLTSPCTSTVLLASSEKLAKNSRLYKALADVGNGAGMDTRSPIARPSDSSSSLGRTRYASTPSSGNSHLHTREMTRYPKGKSRRSSHRRARLNPGNSWTLSRGGTWADA